MVRVYFYIVEKFAMWRTIQPYVEHVKKQPYSPGRARFLQHTSFNINYFFNSYLLWHLQSDRWTVALLNLWYCVCLMSLFYCVVLKNWLIMPLPHSLPTCSSSLLLCIPVAGSMPLIPNTWGSYIRKLCSPSKERLCTHQWFCKSGTVVSAMGREVEDWSWWRLVKWAN